MVVPVQSYCVPLAQHPREQIVIAARIHVLAENKEGRGRRDGRKCVEHFGCASAVGPIVEREGNNRDVGRSTKVQCLQQATFRYQNTRERASRNPNGDEPC
jgi:hypothetical protein